MGSNSPTIAGTPDLFEIKKQTASYTFRTPGTYQLTIPPGVEVRASVQGAQGGGGGAGYSVGGSQGEGGGLVVPGQSGATGGYSETGWNRGPVALVLEVGEGGVGGHGAHRIDGGKGADGWVRVEIRAINLRTRLRYRSVRTWNNTLAWTTWTKVGVIVGILSAILTAVGLVLALA